jgi:hypothetical protein
MVGENQCSRFSEWTSEPPNRTPKKDSRPWRKSHRYKRQILKALAFDVGKVSWFFSANEGGTTGLPSFLDGGLFLFS